MVNLGGVDLGMYSKNLRRICTIDLDMYCTFRYSAVCTVDLGMYGRCGKYLV